MPQTRAQSRLREISLPITAIVDPVLRALTEACGETSHFTLLSGWLQHTIALQESSELNRVTMPVGVDLPLHSTASGLATLAYMGPDAIAHLAEGPLEACSEKTMVDIAELDLALQKIRSRGYVINRGQHVIDVCSVGAPVFNHASRPIGAIAVLAPKSRFGQSQQALIRRLVVDAAEEVTDKSGGRKPATPLEPPSESRSN